MTESRVSSNQQRGKSHDSNYCMMVLMMVVLGCAGQSDLIQIDGTVSQFEEGLVRLGVDAAMAARPELTEPVYKTTTSMLPKMNVTGYSNELISADLIRREAIAAGIMPEQAETLVSFASMVKAAIIAKIGEEKAEVALNSGAVTYELIRIIHDQAERRIKARGP
jgi:hypothetical protein